MLDNSAITINTATLHSLIKWFVDLKELMIHPHLTDDDRILWTWLTAKCAADRLSFICSISYEEIARERGKPLRLIHQSLLNLHTSGFLVADIPIFFGEPTQEMAQKARTMNLIWPYKRYFKPIDRSKKEQTSVSPPTRTEDANVNLIKSQEEEMRCLKKKIKRCSQSFAQKIRIYVRKLRISVCNIE